MTNDQQDSIADQLSIAGNPQILLRSAAKKDSEQSDQSVVEAVLSFSPFVCTGFSISEYTCTG